MEDPHHRASKLFNEMELGKFSPLAKRGPSHEELVGIVRELVSIVQHVAAHGAATREEAEGARRFAANLARVLTGESAASVSANPDPFASP